MKAELRHLQGEEMLNALFDLNSYSLHPSPPVRDKEEWLATVRMRQGMNCWVVFDDESPVSVSVSTPMTQNMRGKLFPASGIWGVSTYPSARRKGYCRQTLAGVLSADRETGKVFSNLYPFRESFYERLGFVSFPLTKIARFSTQSLSPLLKTNPGGQVKVDFIGGVFDTYLAYLAEMRFERHGMALFDHPDRARASKNLMYVARAEFDGSLEGIMLYRILGEEATKYTFSAQRFYYKTSRARCLMLNWIARHVDQAERVELWLAEDEYPESWSADLQVSVESSIRAAMSRVLNVEKIGGMKTGDGSLCIRITDPLCRWNEGCWQLQSSGSELSISRASSADCDLTIQGLTCLVTGSHDPRDIPLRGWGNPDEGQQSILQGMFPRMRPYMHEMF